MNADELAAETKTDRIVRLALTAGRLDAEAEKARGEHVRMKSALARVEVLCRESETGALAVEQVRDALCGDLQWRGHEPVTVYAEVARLRGLCERAGIDTEEGR